MRLVRAAVVLLLVAACGGGVADGSVEVALDEFTVEPASDRWEAGELDVSVVNRGEFAHTLVVSDTTGQVVEATDLIDPGEAAELDVDLEPGTYRLTCRIVVETDDGEVVDHYERGMVATIDVTP